MSDTITTQELLDKLLLESQKLNLGILERDKPRPVALDPEITSELKLPMRNSYALEELFKYDDEEFVRNAFRALLHREPDASGLQAWTLELRACQDKVRIIEALMATEEATIKQVVVHGLDEFHNPPPWRWAKWFPKRAELRRQQHYRHLYEQYHRRSQALKADEINLALSGMSGIRDAMFTMLEQVSTHGWGSVARVRLMEQRIRVLEDALSKVGTVPQQDAPAYQSSARMDAFYMAFENKHRAGRDVLRVHLDNYMQYLPQANADGSSRVVDLGCGRGEWLELLREHNFRVEGVDSNPLMRAHCEELNIPVSGEDLLAWCHAQGDDTYSVVSAFHLAEHLPFEVLLQLMGEAYRLLAPGGLLIMETPNPENMMVATHTFYHDPTHRNPITPTLLHFTTEYQGFEVVAMPRLNPYPVESHVAGDDDVSARVNGHFCGPQDFAIVARKPLG
ncbi:hypothetical protein CHH28_01950 [Bacterioplanes sanyensis]|uniref:DUF4214 domain-containing protein n=1 Tax=Bacterioplanes sanyensis TaxID=1249553 RepID=A0A222FFG8_9GAMM|nr:methyltransferase domain-containing protein [Bacterioplanes sanyensis]ASP37510.1 hypothetical protein CHH28_01950 [Bacterioplanes sanyensis]